MDQTPNGNIRLSEASFNSSAGRPYCLWVDRIRQRVLIVEDEGLTAMLLGETLKRGGFDVAIAGSTLEAVEVADEFDPDGALIDVHLGSGPNGTMLARRLSVSHPTLRIVFLSRFGIREDEDGLHGLPEGCSYVNKATIDQPDHLIEVMRQSMADSTYRLISHLEESTPIRSLTPTQLETLRLAAAGLTNQAIARLQGTVVRNIEQILARAYTALGIEVGGVTNPRVEAIRCYISTFGLPTLHTEQDLHDQ